MEHGLVTGLGLRNLHESRQRGDHAAHLDGVFEAVAVALSIRIVAHAGLGSEFSYRNGTASFQQEQTGTRDRDAGKYCRRDQRRNYLCVLEK